MTTKTLKFIRSIIIRTYHYHGLVWIGGFCLQSKVEHFTKYIRHLVLAYAEERVEIPYYLPGGVLDAVMSDTLFMNLRYHVSVTIPCMMSSNKVLLHGHKHNIKKAIAHIEGIIGELLRLKNNRIRYSCPCPPKRK